MVYYGNMKFDGSDSIFNPTVKIHHCKVLGIALPFSISLQSINPKSIINPSTETENMEILGLGQVQQAARKKAKGQKLWYDFWYQ